MWRGPADENLTLPVLTRSQRKREEDEESDAETKKKDEEKETATNEAEKKSDAETDKTAGKEKSDAETKKEDEEKETTTNEAEKTSDVETDTTVGKEKSDAETTKKDAEKEATNAKRRRAETTVDKGKSDAETGMTERRSDWAMPDKSKVGVRPISYLEAHKRHGHISVEALRQMAEKMTGLRLKGDPSLVQLCDSCFRANGRMAARGKGAVVVGDNHWSSDVVDFPVRCYGGWMSAVIYVHDVTRLWCLYLLKSVSDVPDTLLRLIQDLQLSMRGLQVNYILRSDNHRAEYKCARMQKMKDRLLLEHGVVIRSEHSAVSHQEQNGKPERAFDILKAGGLKLLDDANRQLRRHGRDLVLQQWLLPWAYLDLVHTHNCSVNSATGKVPYEHFTHRRVDLRHKRPWGRLCAVTVPPEDRSLKNMRTREGIMLGQDTNAPQYIVWYPKTNSMAASKDVKVMADRPGPAGPSPDEPAKRAPIGTATTTDERGRPIKETREEDDEGDGLVEDTMDDEDAGTPDTTTVGSEQVSPSPAPTGPKFAEGEPIVIDAPFWSTADGSHMPAPLADCDMRLQARIKRIYEYQGTPCYQLTVYHPSGMIKLHRIRIADVDSDPSVTAAPEETKKDDADDPRQHGSTVDVTNTRRSRRLADKLAPVLTTSDEGRAAIAYAMATYNKTGSTVAGEFLDTGTKFNVTHDRSSFISLDTSQQYYVRGIKNTPVCVVGVGPRRVQLVNEHGHAVTVIEPFQYIPESPLNLWSGGRIFDDKGTVTLDGVNGTASTCIKGITYNLDRHPQIGLFAFRTPKPKNLIMHVAPTEPNLGRKERSRLRRHRHRRRTAKRLRQQRLIDLEDQLSALKKTCTHEDVMRDPLPELHIQMLTPANADDDEGHDPTFAAAVSDAFDTTREWADNTMHAAAAAAFADDLNLTPISDSAHAPVAQPNPGGGLNHDANSVENFSAFVTDFIMHDKKQQERQGEARNIIAGMLPTVHDAVTLDKNADHTDAERQKAKEAAEACGLDDSAVRACIDFVMFIGDVTGTMPTTPKSFDEAMASPEAKLWWDAHNAELQQLIDKKVFKLIKKADVPRGATIMKNKTVYKVKTKDGVFERFKARICAAGYSEIYGKDYTRESAFSPVVRFESLRIVLSIGARRGMLRRTMDVSGAFLHGKLKAKKYMRVPDGMPDRDEDGNELVAELSRGLYGLHESGKLWYDCIDKFFEEEGFTRCRSDNCVYVKRAEDGTMTIVVLYVDDCLCLSDTKEASDKFADALKKKFKCTDDGISDTQIFLSIKIETTEDGNVELSQQALIEAAANEFGVTEMNEIHTPLPAGNAPGPILTPMDEEEKEYMKDKPYLRLISMMQWITKTRPDVVASLSMLGKFAKAPRKRHWKLLVRTLRYLWTTRRARLRYSRRSVPYENGEAEDRLEDYTLVGESDANWDAPTSRESHVFTLHGGMVAVRSKLIPGKAPTSVTEAEVKAATDTGMRACDTTERAQERRREERERQERIREAAKRRGERAEIKNLVQTSMNSDFLRQLIDEILGNDESSTTPILVDNAGTVSIGSNPVRHSSMKHMRIHHHHLRASVKNGDMKLIKCGTDNNSSDMGTKPLGRAKHERFAQHQLGTRVIDHSRLLRQWRRNGRRQPNSDRHG